MKKLFFLSTLFLLFTVHSWGQLSFSERAVHIDSDSPSYLNEVLSDIDGDNDLDLIFSNNDGMFWQENIDGLGTFAKVHSIQEVNPGSRFNAGDIDGDGDIDIVVIGNNHLVWLENIDGLGNFGTENVIYDIDLWPSKILLNDIDGDGNLDVILSSRFGNFIVWYPNLDGLGSFGLQRYITIDNDYYIQVEVADMDGDNDLDILANQTTASSNSNLCLIKWYENTDGDGTFSVEHLVDASSRTNGDVIAVDINSDGHLDIAYSKFAQSSNPSDFVWLQNIDGNGSFGAPQIIDNIPGNYNRDIVGTDVDNDGDNDLIVVNSINGARNLSLYENLDGEGNFNTGEILTLNIDQYEDSISIGDINNDQDQDILIAGYSNFINLLNNDGSGQFDNITLIDGLEDKGGQMVQFSDLNNPEGADMLSSRGEMLQWHPFDLSSQNSLYHEAILINNKNPDVALIKDLDSDGLEDVLFSNSKSGVVAWHKKLSAAGDFGPEQLISTSGQGIKDIYVYDLDQDGFEDIIYCTSFSDAIFWHKNLDGQGNFGTEQFIQTGEYYINSMKLEDVDGDNDKDIVIGTYNNNKVAWYENLDGIGNFGTQQQINIDTERIKHIEIADLDGDGNNDLITATFSGDNNISWQRNTDGQGTFGPQEVLLSNVDRIYPINAKDFDNDGDLDILSGYYNFNYDPNSSGEIIWFENLDGSGNFNDFERIANNTETIVEMTVYDINNDTDLDFATGGINPGKTKWYSNNQILSLASSDKSFDVLIYPNPSKGFYNIEHKEIITEINVFNQMGQLVFEKLDTSGLNNFTLNNISSGIYFVLLIDNNRNKYYQKISKQ